MTNLCEIVALRPDLHSSHKILYFHENQLNYPSRKELDERDFHFGWVQGKKRIACKLQNFCLYLQKLQHNNATLNFESLKILIISMFSTTTKNTPINSLTIFCLWTTVLSCLVADVVAFNSIFNRGHIHICYLSPLISSFPNLHPNR